MWLTDQTRDPFNFFTKDHAGMVITLLRIVNVQLFGIVSSVCPLSVGEQELT